MQTERRKFERLNCYMIAKKPNAEGGEEDFFGAVRNISAGGAMIETEYALIGGEFIALAFLSESNEQIWEGHGRVAWSRLGETKAFVGIEFDQPLEENWHENTEYDFWRK